MPDGDRSRLLFNASALIEVSAGLVSLIAPAPAVGLMLGESLGQTGEGVARVLGVGLLSLGIATFEPARHRPSRPSRLGLCTYNLGITLLLTALGLTGNADGVLLWPAVGLHGLIGVAMLRVLLAAPRRAPAQARG